MNSLEITYDLLSIFGALAFFLFGMKLMSEALQNIAGHRMRHHLSTMTANPWRGLFTGFLITGTLQSSSASTAMLVGFVSAGLLTVLESVGLVFGANIGTTVTSWLITFFGYSFNVRLILLPLIAFSIPLYFSSRSGRKSLAEFIMGFAILFFGLQFLRDTLPEINQHSGILEFLQHQQFEGIGSLLLIVLTGIVITVIIQSSTATITLTMVMFTDGIISFEVAAALIIGENIGTTATANIAAIIGNRNAKRTAFIHFLFNLFGAILFFPILSFYLQLVVYLSDLIAGSDSANPLFLKPLQISIFHTGFNLIVSLILISFTKKLVAVATWFIPVKEYEQQQVMHSYRENFATATSELSLLFGEKKLHEMGLYAQQMFGMIPDLLLEKEPERYARLLQQLRSKEQETDTLEREVMDYLSKLTEHRLSADGSRTVSGMLIVANNLESIADICYKMSKIIDNKNTQKAWFNQDQRNRLFAMFNLVDNALSLMVEHLHQPEKTDIEASERVEEQINQTRQDMIAQHLADMQASAYYFAAGNFYQQLLVYCEKIGDHAINISETLDRQS
ncbi:MAG: Na/Pi cotransporter family protein [Bacteroidetes bacterium]|nr:Na/Pi cotransporter family protein [Bacteroidota bacterium]